MTSSDHFQDEWSDASAEAEMLLPTLQPRAYQIEMFRESMRQNTIVTMETGSGKTMVARLRIEAELERSPDKRIWFTTPNVELVRQQYRFLESQLPAYSFRSITGLDNAEFWNSQDVWDAALSRKHGIISTPQILLDALSHAFVSLEDMSLLVIDEAHHGNKNHPTNATMQLFYHPLRERNPDKAPHILALTATAMNTDDLSLIQTLEQNLNAACRIPSQNVDEYRRFVYLPTFIQLDYTKSMSAESVYLPRLEFIIQNYDIKQDPIYKKYENDESLGGTQRFWKLKQKGSTSVLKQLKRLLNNADFMQHSLGAWATDHYIRACVNNINGHEAATDDWLFIVDNEEKVYLRRIAQSILNKPSEVVHDTQPDASNISDKVKVLAAYLERNHRQGSACILFVQRRSTAWALKELLERMPNLNHCQLFAFVGATNILRNELADLADATLQDNCFADFRAGKRDICIATQVMEEGIDIMACDTVICFDHPSNVKSFIQRRGRARRPDSRFVMLHCPGDASGKYEKWNLLEDMAKEIYTTRKRKLSDLEANEAKNEHCERTFRVPSTGATLTTDNARQHLHHFCATLPRRTGRPEASPIYLYQGCHGHDLSCEVILPSSLPQTLQSVHGLSRWRTETAANKDAAFEAYKKLWEAGLVNDNLLPPKLDKQKASPVDETRESINEIKVAFNPWDLSRSELQTCPKLFINEINLQGCDPSLPYLNLLLATQLAHSIDCELFISPSRQLRARIDPVHDETSIDHALATEITKFLFGISLSRRLPDLGSVDFSLPYFLTPNIQSEELEGWLSSADTMRPLSEHRIERDRVYLLKRGRESILYFLTAEKTYDASQLTEDDEIQVTKLSKRLDFSKPSTAGDDRRQSVKVGQCAVSGLSAAYVTLMAFVPTIMHQVELLLRAQAACGNALRSIEFQDMRLVQTALTAPGANGRDDFQRLEYLGDSLLKFHSTVNVFCNYPQAPESQLTVLRDAIVNNGRLKRATMELELDRYVSTKAFVGHEWTLKHESEEKKNRTRKVSSKTLADVIEALIGAAFVDGSCNARGEEKVLSALTLFFPEITWSSPATDIANLPTPEARVLPINDRLSHVQQIISYQFNNIRLLAEALTHSAVQSSVQSYERLEFLGDAVIDLIVKERLFRSGHEFTEGEMHTRSIALVNKDILAYLATKNGVDVEENTVNMDLRTRQPIIERKVKRKCLHDFMVRLGNEESVRVREEFMQGFTEVQGTIGRELGVGNRYPWTEIYSLNSPKWCSDIFESIIGAVFIDSGGRLDTCREVLECLGLMDLVDRATEDEEMDFKQPMRKMREWFDEKGEKVDVDVKRFSGEGERWACRVRVNEKVRGEIRGCTCREEAESRCAEAVLGLLQGEMGDVVSNMQRNRSSGDVNEEEDEAVDEGMKMEIDSPA